jgi:hypothetical protein
MSLFYKYNYFLLENIIKKYTSKIHKPDKQTIYLLTCENKNIPLAYCLMFFLLNQYNISLINNIDNIDINSHPIILPIDVKAQELLYNDTIYSIFDNKKKFYEYIINKKILKNNKIKLIKSYDDNYQGENKYGNYILKPINAKGGEGILYKKGNIKDLISKYKDYQIQDVLNFEFVYSVNCFVKNGIIKNSVYYKSKPNKNTLSYLTGVEDNILQNIPSNMKRFCKTLLNTTKYNGFIEFEFSKEKSGKVYIMECNPRMSGWCVYQNYYKKLIEKNFGIQSDYADYLSQNTKFSPGNVIKDNNPLNNFKDYIKFRKTTKFL